MARSIRAPHRTQSPEGRTQASPDASAPEPIDTERPTPTVDAPDPARAI
jgi:hypothetical protein